MVKSAKHYTETVADEIKLLKCARDGDAMDAMRFKTVQLLDNFKVTGPSGVYVCMVFEVLGNNLLIYILYTLLIYFISSQFFLSLAHIAFFSSMCAKSREAIDSPVSFLALHNQIGNFIINSFHHKLEKRDFLDLATGILDTLDTNMDDSVNLVVNIPLYGMNTLEIAARGNRQKFVASNFFTKSVEQDMERRDHHTQRLGNHDQSKHIVSRISHIVMSA